jgi:hypothetical protein
MNSLLTALFTPTAAAWLALFVGLILMSVLVREHLLVRLVQHIFVGAALGYAALLAVREVLLPRFAAAWTGGGDGWSLAPLLLGLIMWLAGLDYMRQSSKLGAMPRWRRIVRQLGLIPVMLMIGVGVTVAVLGLFQGTLLPQSGVVVGNDIRLDALPLDLFSAILMLVLTTATLLHLTWPQGWRASGVTRWLQAPVEVWRWIGLRALWLATGILFARLAAARLSLLIGWFESVGRQLDATGLRGLLLSLWERL